MKLLGTVPRELEDALRAEADRIAGPVGGVVTDIRYDTDMDDDECLNVVVEYPRPAESAEWRVTSAMDKALIDVAIALGEPRYLYIRHRYLGGGPVTGFHSKRATA